jgi:PleD family two-component response regulator
MEERRRQRRVRVAGVAVVRGGAQPPAVWRVADLSLGGASLVGDGALPADRFLFGLHVAGFEAVELEARVLRKQLVTRAGRCAVKFVGVSEVQTEMLREIVGADHGPSLVKRRALIVEGQERQAAALSGELASMGFTIRRVASPEQAAAWLQKENTDVLVVGERVVETNRWGLLQFVRDTAPEIRRLVLVDDVPGFRLYYAMKAGLVEGLIEPKMPRDTLARYLLGAPPAKSRPRASRRRRRSAELA